MAKEVKGVIDGLDCALGKVDEATDRMILTHRKIYIGLLESIQARQARTPEDEEIMKIIEDNNEIFATMNQMLVLSHLGRSVLSTWGELKVVLKRDNPTYVSKALRPLQEYGAVRRIKKGLYEITEYGRMHLWIFTEQATRVCRALVEVGYDFPLSDERTRELVYKAFV